MNRVDAPTPSSRPRKRGGLVVPHAPRWHQRLAAWFVYVLVYTVSGTLRWHWTDRCGFLSGGAKPAIYCIWHNRLATCMRVYWGSIHPLSATPGLAALVSASKDGGFLTGILECFKVQPVRGSSSRRGAQAMLELTSWADRGYDLAITPDGPRGPRYVVQEGVVALAQLSGRPIVPVSINLGWKIQLKSWDRFQIPLPFSRCEVILEQPVPVPRQATDAEREACRLRVEELLRATARD